MKKYLLATTLVMASASAMADEWITTDSSGLNYPLTKSEACAQAKRNAQQEAVAKSSEVEQYSACLCDKDDSHGHTHCTVDAKIAKRK